MTRLKDPRSPDAGAKYEYSGSGIELNTSADNGERISWVITYSIPIQSSWTP